MAVLAVTHVTDQVITVAVVAANSPDDDNNFAIIIRL